MVTRFSIIAAIGLLLPLKAKAQGTLYVSNLSEASTSSASIGSDSWIAQDFYTGSNPTGYVLNSVQLIMDEASGSPNGFSVSIYSRSVSPIGPQDYVASLSGSDDPSTAGIYSYTSSSIVLSPATYYCVVITAATTVADGDYSMAMASSGRGDSSDGWLLPRLSYYSADGLSWPSFSRQRYFQFAIYATPVPEPSTCALLGLSLVALSFWRRRR